MEFIEQENRNHSASRYILITTGSQGRALFENSDIDKELRIKKVFIFGRKRNINFIWMSKYEKTKDLLTFNSSPFKLAYQITKFLQSELPERFCEEDPMEPFKLAYEAYYKEKHGVDWTGEILEEKYLLDFKESLEKLYEIEGSINPEFTKGKIKEE